MYVDLVQIHGQADDFGDWEANDFAPEETFLKKLESIDGITTIETQTYTIMPM